MHQSVLYRGWRNKMSFFAAVCTRYVFNMKGLKRKMKQTKAIKVTEMANMSAINVTKVVQLIWIRTLLLKSLCLMDPIILWVWCDTNGVPMISLVLQSYVLNYSWGFLLLNSVWCFFNTTLTYHTDCMIFIIPVTSIKWQRLVASQRTCLMFSHVH